MLVMQLPDGTTAEYRLRSTTRGLRLERSCASYDLLTLVRDAGWIVRAVKTDIARRRLVRLSSRTPVGQPGRRAVTIPAPPGGEPFTLTA